jgi:putative peptidoglycan lipid II flippase
MLLLRRTLNARVGTTGLPASYVVKLWTAAAAGAAVAWAVKLSIPPLPPVIAAMLIIGPYGVVFLTMTVVLRVEGAVSTMKRLMRRS